MIRAKTGFLILMLAFITVISFSQQSKFDKIQSKKITFFTEKMNLSADEATKFWPIYNDYQSRKNKIIQERNNLVRYYSQNSQNMTEKEIKETLGKYIQFQKDETELLDIYNEKFKSILPEQKVMKIYIAELDFRNYLLQQLKEN